MTRAARALGVNRVDQAVAKVRAIIGPADIPASEAQAQSALDKLQNGESPTVEELMALEVVVRLLRPVVFSRNGELDDLPDQAGKNLQPAELKDLWSVFRDRVKPVLHSIGRIDSTGRGHVGSGFLVTDRLLATNRHVLDQLSFGTGVLAAGAAKVVFKGEKGSVDPPEHVIAIEGVAVVHPDLDMALLEIVAQVDRPRLEFADTHPAAGDRVVAVGYPAEDRVNNPLFLASVFPQPFGVKRAALGEVLDGGRLPSLFHDCSTLGGNSGSPVFSLETGKVIAIHRAGFFMYRNESVESGELLDLVRSVPA